MKYQTNAPAYHCMPIKDEFGRIIAAIPGFTKYEQVLLSILCAKESQNNKSNIGVSTLLRECEVLANEYFKTLEKLENAKENNPSVIQM